MTHRACSPECAASLVERDKEDKARKESRLHRAKLADSKPLSHWIKLTEAVVHAYIHVGGKVGVLVEINCETDFVAKTDDFKAFCQDVCLQIAAASPSYVRREEVPEADLAKERDIAAAQMAGKPPAAVQKIVEGKLEKYYSQVCLLDQPFVKAPEKMIKDILSEKVGKLGENIVIRRFTRYQLGA